MPAVLTRTWKPECIRAVPAARGDSKSRTRTFKERSRHVINTGTWRVRPCDARDVAPMELGPVGITYTTPGGRSAVAHPQGRGSRARRRQKVLYALGASCFRRAYHRQHSHLGCLTGSKTWTSREHDLASTRSSDVRRSGYFPFADSGREGNGGDETSEGANPKSRPQCFGAASPQSCFRRASRPQPER